MARLHARQRPHHSPKLACRVPPFSANSKEHVLYPGRLASVTRSGESAGCQDFPQAVDRIAS
jgi:hypothetical protein